MKPHLPHLPHLSQAQLPRRCAQHAIALALLAGAALAAAQPGPPPSPAMLAAAALNPTVAAGDSWIVERTTALQSLKIEPGAMLAAPAGHSLTMTVDGVETALLPGTYRGRIVLTVTELHAVRFSPTLTHHFRQALYLDRSGVVASKSVTAAAGPYTLKDGVLSGARIRSLAPNFNGILVSGGHYTVKDLVLDFVGNGGNDFAGHGAGVMSDGKDTTLVLDGARISTHGAVRTAVIGNNGSHLIVKHSDISASSGVLPADYVSNVTPGEMKDAPWMLGIRGNVRSTNVLGDDTRCTYIDSRLSADAWGVLSVDNSQRIQLTAINSRIEVTGSSGYGSYAIGDSTNAFYGSTIDVPTHGVVITGGRAIFGASRPDTVARLDQQLKLGLGPAERAALPVRQTVVRSQRFGVMMWGDAHVEIADGTVFSTGEAVFLNKGTTADIRVDGSGGARLEPRNGVIYQAIDNDDPGPVMVDGLMANTGVYREPAEAPARLPGFDLSARHASDTVARVANIRLEGDFYNAMRQLALGGGFGPDGPSKMPPVITGANLVLEFSGAQISGVISSAMARHVEPVIGAANFEQLARVVNTPAPAINNGVIVQLVKSRWTVTGTSYLNELTIGAESTLGAPAGRTLAMTVDGVATPIRPGRYRGQIVLQASAR